MGGELDEADAIVLAKLLCRHLDIDDRGDPLAVFDAGEELLDGISDVWWIRIIAAWAEAGPPPPLRERAVKDLTISCFAAPETPGQVRLVGEAIARRRGLVLPVDWELRAAPVVLAAGDNWYAVITKIVEERQHETGG